MNRYIVIFALAWVIIIGALMFAPGIVTCIACGAKASQVLGLLTVIVGVTALAMNWKSLARG